MTGRHQLATIYETTATRVHQAWLERRARTPWPWIWPLAIITSLIVGS